MLFIEYFFARLTYKLNRSLSPIPRFPDELGPVKDFKRYLDNIAFGLTPSTRFDREAFKRLTTRMAGALNGDNTIEEVVEARVSYEQMVVETVFYPQLVFPDGQQHSLRQRVNGFKVKTMSVGLSREYGSEELQEGLAEAQRFRHYFGFEKVMKKFFFIASRGQLTNNQLPPTIINNQRKGALGIIND